MDSNFNLLANLRTHKKTVLIIIVTLFLIIILALLIIHLTSKSWIPLKNENLIPAPNSEIDRFKHYIEFELDKLGYPNVKDATIREGSIETTEERSENGRITHNSTFLIDIDSIQQTYTANILWSNQPVGTDTVSLLCPKISESKYPDSECATTYNTSHTIDLWLPHELTLDTGEKAVVKDTTIEQNGKTLQIYLYSCDDPNPPLKATEEVVKSWVEDTVKDPLADKYQYHVRYGYCPNDPY